MNEIKCSDVNNFSNKFFSEDKNKLAQNAVRKANNVSSVLMDAYKAKEYNEVFSDAIHVDVKQSNQGSSGRCWLFAALNIIRLNMIQNYKLDKDFELSQAYPFFWDQFEKSNYFLRNVIKYRKESIQNEYNRQILADPVSDGGQWNMIVNIVKKYGLVPKNDMDETFHTSHTESMKSFLNDKLREYAVELRKLPESYFHSDTAKLNKVLKKMLYNIFKILTIFMGTPPDRIDWSFYQNIPKKSKKRKTLKKGKKQKTKRNKGKKAKKAKKGGNGYRQGDEEQEVINRRFFKGVMKTNNSEKTYSIIKNVTPSEFYEKHIPYKCEDKIALINFPHKERPFFKKYKVKMSNNMDNDNVSTYINVPIEVMMNSTANSIKNGEAVWFGSDVDKNVHHKNGVMDDVSINYEETIGLKLEIDKGNALFTKAGVVNHAMVLKGFNVLNENEINKWWVENSWGESNDNLGNYVMSTSWFKKNVYECVVDKKYCDPRIHKVLKQKATMLEIWDPFGNLLIK